MPTKNFEELITSEYAQDALDIIKKKRSFERTVTELKVVLGEDMPEREDIPKLLGGLEKLKREIRKKYRTIKRGVIGSQDIPPSYRNLNIEKSLLKDLFSIKEFLLNSQEQCKNEIK